MLKLKDVSFSYGKKRILSSFGFELGKGECLVLAGPNGSGKSTALSLMAGVLRPERGSIEAEGKIGYVPQGTALFEDMSVGDNLSFFASLAGCKVPQSLPFGLDELRKVRVSKLSGGMQKLLSIACGMLGQPNILLLDEPCAGLDVQHRVELSAELLRFKSGGGSIVFVSHEPDEFFGIFDKLIFLSDCAECFSRAQLCGDADTLDELSRNFKLLFRE